MREPKKPITLLLVEDSLEDVELTRFAFRKSTVLNRIEVARDGQQCMEYLEENELPDLILLDLNMPRKGGKEVLEELKTDERFRFIPVIVLTTSQADQDVRESYERYANSYVIKPMGFDRFDEVVKAIDAFWLNLVQLPRRIDS